jgi:hypothetical protein
MKPKLLTSLVSGAAMVLMSAAPVPMAATAARRLQDPSTFTEPLHRPLDHFLDIYVRDGLVYYRALKAERARFDRYVAALNVTPATYGGLTREQQMAFWLNAYNVFVMQTVIDNYPIRGRSDAYPPSSIRQIPGAFERTKHRAAGRSVTLDEIEKTVLPAFKEPRLYLALGRGAVGSGRLRSEAYTGDRLMSQLDAVQTDFMTRRAMLSIDRGNDVMSLTPIVSWHEAEFVAAYDKGDAGLHGKRSPIERAMVNFVTPRLLPLEKEFVQKNTFRVVFHAFDWRLNDLTGGRPD